MCCLALLFSFPVDIFQKNFLLFFGKNNKSGTRGDSQVCHLCSYHILTSSVKRHTATWNLLVLNNKETNHSSFFFIYISESFSVTRKPAFSLFRVQNEAQENHTIVKLHSKGFSWNEILQKKHNGTAESTSHKENAVKNKPFFRH